MRRVIEQAGDRQTRGAETKKDRFYFFRCPEIPRPAPHNLGDNKKSQGETDNACQPRRYGIRVPENKAGFMNNRLAKINNLQGNDYEADYDERASYDSRFEPRRTDKNHLELHYRNDGQKQKGDRQHIAQRHKARIATRQKKGKSIRSPRVPQQS